METEKLIIRADKVGNDYIRVEIQNGDCIAGLLRSRGFHLGLTMGRRYRVWPASSLENLLVTVEEIRQAAHSEGQKIVLVNVTTRSIYDDDDYYQDGLKSWA